MERLPVFELIDQTVKILNDNRKMLDMMVMGAKDYLAQTTPGDTWLDVSESDDGALSLKERK